MRVYLSRTLTIKPKKVKSEADRRCGIDRHHTRQPAQALAREGVLVAPGGFGHPEHFRVGPGDRIPRCIGYRKPRLHHGAAMSGMTHIR